MRHSLADEDVELQIAADDSGFLGCPDVGPSDRVKIAGNDVIGGGVGARVCCSGEREGNDYE